MTEEELDLVPADDLFAAFVRRWPDCILVAVKQSSEEGRLVQYRRRAGNPLTILGILMIEVQEAQRDILTDRSPAKEDDV